MSLFRTFGKRIGVWLRSSEYARLFLDRSDETKGRKCLIYNTLFANIAV